MKATLEFTLPEEGQEYRTCVNADRYYTTLWDVDQRLRNILKYENPKDSNAFEDLRRIITEGVEGTNWMEG